MLPTQCVIRWPSVFMRGYRSLSPERMQGNGWENCVLLFEHLLAKCKQTETRSSPTTGAAASKNNPNTQQIRNLLTNGYQYNQAILVSQSIQLFLCMERRVFPEELQLGVLHVRTLLSIKLCERAGVYCFRSVRGSVWAAWETVITFSLCIPFITVCYSCSLKEHINSVRYGLTSL